jgi:hypothetical protein
VVGNENIPINCIGILSSLYLKDKQWSSVLGSMLWIFGVSLRTTPPIFMMKGGIRFDFIVGMDKAFLNRRMYDLLHAMCVPI